MSNCINCTNSFSCNACDLGFTFVGTSCVVACPPGYWLDMGNCNLCRLIVSLVRILPYVIDAIPHISGMMIHVCKHVLMANGLKQTHALVSPAYLTVLFVQVALHVIFVVQLTLRKEIHVHKIVLQANMQIVQQVLVKIAKTIVSLAKVMLYVIHDI